MMILPMRAFDALVHLKNMASCAHMLLQCHSIYNNIEFWGVIECFVEGIYIFSDYKQEVYDDIKGIIGSFDLLFWSGAIDLYTGGMLIKLLNR